MEDLRASRAHLTWWSSQDGNPIYKKLDRVLVNDHWLTQMGSSSAFFGPMGLSDHCHVILLSGLVMSEIPKPFQFFNFMQDLEGYSSVLRSAWD